MIYGYPVRTINEFGLNELREVSISASPELLRSLARCLFDAAIELESGPKSAHWHRHLPRKLSDELGCDIVVIQDSNRAGESDDQQN